MMKMHESSVEEMSPFEAEIPLCLVIHQSQSSFLGLLSYTLHLFEKNKLLLFQGFMILLRFFQRIDACTDL